MCGFQRQNGSWIWLPWASKCVRREEDAKNEYKIVKLYQLASYQESARVEFDNPDFAASYWSSLQGEEWLKPNRAWICWSGSAARCPAAQAGMPAGGGALSGWGGRGRRIWQGLGVSGVVIDSTPATVLNRSGMPRSVAQGQWAAVGHA